MKQKFSQSVLRRVLQVFLRIFKFFSPPQKIVENALFLSKFTTIYGGRKREKNNAYNIILRAHRACVRKKEEKNRRKKNAVHIRILFAFSMQLCYNR